MAPLGDARRMITGLFLYLDKTYCPPATGAVLAGLSRSLHTIPRCPSDETVTMATGNCPTTDAVCPRIWPHCLRPWRTP